MGGECVRACVREKRRRIPTGLESPIKSVDSAIGETTGDQPVSDSNSPIGKRRGGERRRERRKKREALTLESTCDAMRKR
jgi:hypothetical protein